MLRFLEQTKVIGIDKNRKESGILYFTLTIDIPFHNKLYIKIIIHEQTTNRNSNTLKTRKDEAKAVQININEHCPLINLTNNPQRLYQK